MPTTIEIPHYQLDTNDKQSIGTFLELGKKYKLFEVYEDSSGEHYRYLPQLNMLAYLSSTFDEQKCIRFLNASMGGGIPNVTKFSKDFGPLYVIALRKAQSDNELQGIQKDLVDKEIANAGGANSAPSAAFLPERYTQAKEDLGKNGVWLKPFHEKLEELVKGSSNHTLSGLKQELADDLDIGKIRFALEAYKELFKKEKKLFELLSKEDARRQTSLFTYVVEMYKSGQDTSGIEQLLIAAQKTGDYRALIIALYNGGIIFAKQVGGSNAENQGKALNNYIKELNTIGGNVSLSDIKSSNVLIAPPSVNGFCTYLKSNNVSLYKIVNSIK